MDPWILAFFSHFFFILIFHLKPSMCIDVSTVYPVLYMLAVSLSGSADVLAAFVVIIMLFFFFFFFATHGCSPFAQIPHKMVARKKNGKERGKKVKLIFSHKLPLTGNSTYFSAN